MFIEEPFVQMVGIAHPPPGRDFCYDHHAPTALLALHPVPVTILCSVVGLQTGIALSIFVDVDRQRSSVLSTYVMSC